MGRSPLIFGLLAVEWSSFSDTCTNFHALDCCAAAIETSCKMMMQCGRALPAVPAQRRPRPFVQASGRPALAPAPVHRRSIAAHRCHATSTDGQATQYTPKSARDAIETATKLQKEQKDYKEAVRLYVKAMEMNPNDDEARAALYNMGCALAKQKQWVKSTECVMRAINDYNLKLVVALKVSSQPHVPTPRTSGWVTRTHSLDLTATPKCRLHICHEHAIATHPRCRRHLLEAPPPTTYKSHHTHQASHIQRGCHGRLHHDTPTHNAQAPHPTQPAIRPCRTPMPPTPTRHPRDTPMWHTHPAGTMSHGVICLE